MHLDPNNNFIKTLLFFFDIYFIILKNEIVYNNIKSMSYLYENNQQFRKNQKHNSMTSQNNPQEKNNHRESIPINPDILNYIQKVQNDKNKDKSKHNLQHKNSIPSQYDRLITQKMKFNAQSQNQIFSEDMTFDKDKRFTAKKGLLLLLNNISKGTFCPDIEEYFKKMKEKKLEEFKTKIKNDINSFNIMEDMDKKGKKKKTRDSSIKRLLNSMTENSENIGGENRINYNFKKKEKNNENNREEIGIKKYENDYDEDELIDLYDKKEIKDNLFHINYNKEKLYKMKLKKENMQNNKDKDK